MIQSGYKTWRKIEYYGLLLIPVSLVFSLKLNSIVIILMLLLESKRLIRRFPITNAIHRKIFLASLLFVFSFIFGSIIDLYYGEFQLKRLEKLLPFIAIPLILILGLSRRFKTDQILRDYAYAITAINLLLISVSFIALIAKLDQSPFTGAKWVKSGTSLTQSKALESPDGSFTAIKLQEGPEHQSHNLLITINLENSVNKDYYRSVFAKAAERDWILLRQYDGVTHSGAWFNVQDGTIGIVHSGINAQIQDWGNGWYRCSIINSVSEKASQERFQISVVDGNGGFLHKGDGSSGIYLWGPSMGSGNVIPEVLPSSRNIDTSSFFGQNLLGPLDNHPSYYGLFVLLTILITLFAGNGKWNIFSLTITGINIVVLILLSSKAVLIALLFSLGFASIALLFKHPKKGVLILLLLLGSICLTLTLPKVRLRIQQSVETVLLEKNKDLSTGQRIMIWESILKLDRKQLLIGFGNERGEKILEEITGTDLNAHNQYLQALLGGGVLSLFLLVIYLISPLFFKTTYPDSETLLMFSFIIAVLVSCLFESVLNRQWGIVFIAFFYSLFFRGRVSNPA